MMRIRKGWTVVICLLVFVCLAGGALGVGTRLSATQTLKAEGAPSGSIGVFNFATAAFDWTLGEFDFDVPITIDDRQWVGIYAYDNVQGTYTGATFLFFQPY